jgi:hypothetical protein
LVKRFVERESTHVGDVYACGCVVYKTGEDNAGRVLLANTFGVRCDSVWTVDFKFVLEK